MRCIKTGCTVKWDTYQYHGDLFIADSGEFILKGVPRIDGVFGNRDNIFKVDATSSLLVFDGLYGTAIKYGQFNIHDLNPKQHLLDHFKEWEPTIYQRFKGE